MSAPKRIPVAAIQFEPAFNDLKRNREKVQKLILESLTKEPKLIVLPELAFSGYNFKDSKEVEETAERIPTSESCKILQDLAQDNKIFIVSGINEKTEQGSFNSAVAFGPDGYILTYRKIHLYSQEKVFFLAGDQPPKLFEIKGVKIGIMVCFDWFFPELPRTLALLGADIIAHPMNAVIKEGAYLGNVFHSKWNRVAIILANRIGAEGDLTYIGLSQITDATGKVLARASENREEILHAEINVALSRNKKINAYNNVLLDRRPEFYFRRGLPKSD